MTPDWLALPVPARDGHKHQRGHVLVASGGAASTGAARLAAMAALRVGAGVVTLASPGSAMLVNAAHLTAVMLARADGAEDLAPLAAGRHVVMGMGFGLEPEPERRRMIGVALKRGTSVVLDADALTLFRDDPAELFACIATRTDALPVLTPHEGEFARLFGIEGEREKRAVEAARRSGAVVVLKGERTVVAAPDGRCHVNDHASPYLATAGSGDVLAGIVGGLQAQGLKPFEAARAAVWLHGDAGLRGGQGLIAEDLPNLLRETLRGL